MYQQMKEEKKRTSESFELLYKGKANDVLPVFKYKSKKTGMQVVIAQVEGPIVDGYFCLATEAFDDDGLPHTLEHLVFMGSEEYPYKGVLDLLANRCLASGTNAWTDVDHTCYTMTTAGSEGFLTLMPIYLDHLLYPTITESAYKTEVHHVNPEGEDSGVVYCEMQGCENTGENRIHLAFNRAMYPGKCGYKSETGGMLLNLRESTSHRKVCDYHKEFYRPENLCLVITGQVQPEEVFASLQAFEEKITAKGDRGPFTTPWSGPVPALEKSVEEVMPYPSDSEEFGMVSIGWRGPLAKEQYKLKSIMIMMEYMTDTAVAPFQRDFVEVEDPWCNDVRYGISENKESAFSMKFVNVPKAKLKDIKPKALALLEKIAKQEEKLDMKRMGDIIHKQFLSAISSLEDRPHEAMAFALIGDFLYGQSNDDIAERLNPLGAFKKLKTESEQYWLDVLNTYIVGKNSVAIVGEPSISLMEKMGEEEKQRVAKQVEKLGEGGLKKLAEELEKATQENETEPPQEMITKVQVPDVGRLVFHTIKATSNSDPAKADDNSNFPLSEMPVTFELDDVQSHFVTLSLMMNTGSVPKELRAYLPLYVEVMLESPVLRDGKLISHEDVITQLSSDTLENSATVGALASRFSISSFGDLIDLNLKVEVDKYQKGVQWLRELLYQMQFTEERVKIIAMKMVNDVARLKRKGPKVLTTLLTDILMNKDSNHYNVSMFRQQKFLNDVLAKIDKEEGAKEILGNLKKVQSILTQPSNMKVHMAGRTSSLECPSKVWMDHLLPEEQRGSGEKTRLQCIKKASEYMYKDGDSPISGLIAGIGAVESSYMYQIRTCLSDYEHADYAPLLVAIQYLTMLEGPMWRQIRGLGLSYHYSISLNMEQGTIQLLLYKSTHIVNAYKEAKSIVDGFVTGTSEFTAVDTETCKSSLIFEIIEAEKTPTSVCEQSRMSYLRGTDIDFNRRLLKKIPGVSVADMKRVTKEYLSPLFESAQSKIAIVCHPTKVEEIVADMKTLSRELKVVDSLEESFLAEWK